MPATGLFGNGNQDDTLGKDYDRDNTQMTGWLSKQGDTFRSWKRRYFALSGNILAWYNDENIQKSHPRSLFRVLEVHPLTSIDRGILLVSDNRRELRLVADTKVAYTAWFSLLSAAVSKTTSMATHDSSSTSSSLCKSGWAHYRFPEGHWTRYYIVIQKDVMNCYESDDPNATLELSGIIRSVQQWDGKKFGVVVGLNMKRNIHLCFDTLEDKTAWLLALEFAVAYSFEQSKERKQSVPVSNSSSVGSSNDTATEDDGVWI